MADHRWSAVAITELDEAQAEAFAGTDLMDRIDGLCNLVGETTVRAVRGPICSDCRVSWEDVHRTGGYWPCKGERPADLGGPLNAPQPELTRQQRRKQRAEAAKPVSPGALPGDLAMQRVRAAMARAVQEREPAWEDPTSSPPARPLLRDPDPALIRP